jgi:hypothetical protein
MPAERSAGGAGTDQRPPANQGGRATGSLKDAGKYLSLADAIQTL